MAALTTQRLWVSHTQGRRGMWSSLTRRWGLRRWRSSPDQEDSIAARADSTKELPGHLPVAGPHLDQISAANLSRVIFRCQPPCEGPWLAQRLPVPHRDLCIAPAVRDQPEQEDSSCSKTGRILRRRWPLTGPRTARRPRTTKPVSLALHGSDQSRYGDRSFRHQLMQPQNVAVSTAEPPGNGASQRARLGDATHTG
jgi:hypothetical protein